MSLIGCGRSDFNNTRGRSPNNDIDNEILPELTAGDLIGLGAMSIGHCRKPLEAIAAFAATRRKPRREPGRCRLAALQSGLLNRRDQHSVERDMAKSAILSNLVKASADGRPTDVLVFGVANGCPTKTASQPGNTPTQAAPD